MRLLNQARLIIIVLNCNFVNCSEATKSSEVVNPSEALNTAATVHLEGSTSKRNGEEVKRDDSSSEFLVNSCTFCFDMLR